MEPIVFGTSLQKNPFWFDRGQGQGIQEVGQECQILRTQGVYVGPISGRIISDVRHDLLRHNKLWQNESRFGAEGVLCGLSRHRTSISKKLNLYRWLEGINSPQAFFRQWGRLNVRCKVDVVAVHNQHHQQTYCPRTHALTL